MRPLACENYQARPHRSIGALNALRYGHSRLLEEIFIVLNSHSKRGIALSQKIFGVLLTLLCIMGSLFISPAAMAAPASVTFSNQAFDKTEMTSGESTRFSFNWAVADGSRGGDTFTIVLPDELRPSSTAGFALRNSANDVVANAVWSGNTATFTLTDFVNDKFSVNGSAYFTVAWDRRVVDVERGGTYSLQFTGSGSWTLPLTLLPDGEGGDGQSTSKVGWWLSDDQGASSSERQLGWVVYLDTGTGDHIDAPVVIVDTPGPSSIINIDSVKGFVDHIEMDSSRYTVAREGARGVRIELFGNHPGESAVYAGENIYFRYDSNLLPGENGVFRNSAVVTGLADDPQIVDAEILRDGAGGDGDGEVRSVAPVMPEVVQAECTAEGTATGPSLTFPTTDGITYTPDVAPAPGVAVTVTATAADGYVLTAAEGWTLADDGRTATTTITFTDPDCDQPVAPVTPSSNPVLAGTGSALPFVPTITGLLLVIAGGASFLLMRRNAH